MKKYFLSVGVLFLGLLVGVSATNIFTRLQSSPTLNVAGIVAVDQSAKSMFVSGKAAPHRLLVKFRDNVSEKNKNEALRSANVQAEKEIAPLGIKIIELPAQANEQAQLNAFRGRSDIEFAEPDMIIKPGVIPNDPLYRSGEQWYLSKVGAPITWTAWSVADGQPVTIAILDSGISNAHPDLASNLVLGWNVYSNNSDTQDRLGHGTAVAGVAAAVTGNGQGMASLCRGCKLMPIKITDDSAGYTYWSTVAQGLVWAGDHGARVANISYNSEPPSPPMDSSATVANAAKYFVDKTEGVVTNSAGNNATFRAYPNNSDIIVLGATDEADNVTSFSDTGNNIDLSAPGINMTSTKLPSSYDSWSGTSFSAPLTAGVAALLFSFNPFLTDSGMQQLLKSSVDDLGSAGWDSIYGAGRLNVSKAFNKLVPYADIEANGSDGPINLQLGQELTISWHSFGAAECDRVGTDPDYPSAGDLPSRSMSWTPIISDLGKTYTYGIVCGGKSDNVVVSIVDNPLVPNAGPDKTINSGGSVTLEGWATGGVPPYTYSWTPITGLSNPNISRPTASPAITTNFLMTVKDSNNRILADSVLVTVNPISSLKYAITTKVFPGGSGTVSGGGIYNSGERVLLSASPSPNYGFSHWSGSISGNTNPTIIIVNSNKTIVANFVLSQPPKPNCVKADVTGDRTVNNFDILAIRGKIGCTTATPPPYPSACLKADANGDGLVNNFDNLFVRGQIGCAMAPFLSIDSCMANATPLAGNPASAQVTWQVAASGGSGDANNYVFTWTLDGVGISGMDSGIMSSLSRVYSPASPPPLTVSNVSSVAVYDSVTGESMDTPCPSAVVACPAGFSWDNAGRVCVATTVMINSFNQVAGVIQGLLHWFIGDK